MVWQAQKMRVVIWNLLEQLSARKLEACVPSFCLCFILTLCELTVGVRYRTGAHSTVTVSTRPCTFARPAREEHSRSWVGC